MIQTRLTERFGVEHPIISAPMAFAAGGALAAAVSQAGGLGLIGGGYGDEDWLRRELEAAGNIAVGCGFITWSLAEQPHLLDIVLDRKPQALFLSFGDPKPFAARAIAAGVPVICQTQTLADAQAAVAAGASVIVAQGAEAGGHGERRGTISLTVEIRAWLEENAPDVLLCAAGGVADGRGLAAALTLGADGVVVGTRFWAAQEALVHPGMHEAAIAATGDQTIRTSAVDIVRAKDWPARFDIRVLRNSFTDRWHGREDALRAHVDAEAATWSAALAAGDASTANPIVGEAVGLVRDIAPAGEIVETMVRDAERAIGAAARLVSANGT